MSQNSSQRAAYIAYFESRAKREVEKLNSMYDFIESWDYEESERIESLVPDVPSALLQGMVDNGFDPWSDAHESARDLFDAFKGGMAVAITGSVDGSRLAMAQTLFSQHTKCRANDAADDSQQSADVWNQIERGAMRQLSTWVGADLISKDRPANTARLVANCFKHNDSFVDTKLCQRIDQPIGDRLDYKSLDYRSMISDTEDMLNEIIQKYSVYLA